jgi:hypothetical protein
LQFPRQHKIAAVGRKVGEKEVLPYAVLAGDMFPHAVHHLIRVPRRLPGLNNNLASRKSNPEGLKNNPGKLQIEVVPTAT